ncbi:murein biosynthesis integral membrane protein MurJ [Alkalimarinus coralli]|uniref:murein biosynthesis integral membrane protein MurJ n=2 Tax=Alkalimarinus coralli TaxID=2935863 RepID=UPI002112D21D|nr:murein biosynthesis integral membrane protein MurJ [Alkalimarinus coralli]
MSRQASAPGKLLRSSSVVGSMTMLSRILGLVRDIVIARYFGAGAGADAFFVAFKIPNFLRRLFAEGAFSQAFVPVLSEYRTNHTLRDVRTLINSVAGVLGMVLLVVTLLAVAGAPVLTAVFAPGFIGDEEKFSLASDMLRLTFPYLLLISLTAFAGSILNSYGRFAVPAFTPVLLNLCLISSAIWLSPLFEHPIIAMAWGVLVAGMLQLFFQFPFLLRLGLLPRPKLDYRHEGVIRIMRLMLPALFGVSVSQINLLLDTVLASFLKTGSVSWLYYSDRLSELPLGVFGVAIATVILPSLSRKHTRDSSDAFAATLDWALRVVLLIGFPAATALLLLAEPLLATLFYHGELTEVDVAMSTLSLRAYASGLMAFMLVKVLAPGYFSRQDTKTPVKIGVIAMVVNMVFNLILIWPLAHTGLALATALSAWLNAYLLYRGLQKDGVYWLQEGWGKFLAQLLVSLLVMSGVILMLLYQFPDWLLMSVMERISYLAVIVISGGVSYFLALHLSGVRLASLVARR